MCGSSIYTKIHPMQIRRAELENKPDTIWEVLHNGSQRAQLAAESVMKDVRAVMGLSRDLSGVRTAKSISPEEKADDVRDLSSFSDWAGLEPAVLTRNISEVWRRQILSPEIVLKQDSGEMWLTLNKRRVCVSAAAKVINLDQWRFAVQAKSYEILALLCWDGDGKLHDFIVPQKLYLTDWVAAKKEVGKGMIGLEVRKHEGRFLLRIGSSQESIDITDTERNYATL
jgi:tryptophanyl-tRNA synthetase